MNRDMANGGWPAGWYLIDAVVRAPVAHAWLAITPGSEAGAPEEPGQKLFVSVGTGNATRLQMVFPLHRPACGIEIHSDDESVRDALSDCVPRPIGRREAAWRMLGSRPGEAVAVGAIAALKSGWNLLRSAMGWRLAGIGERVWRRYLYANEAAGGGPYSSELRLRRGSFGPLRRGRLLATSQLERVGMGGGRWLCTGDDPQFMVSDGDTKLPAGWYAFEYRISDLRYQGISPCLYPDYGRGHAQSDAIALPDADEAGWTRALVRLAYDTRSLRFDPTSSGAEFDLHDCRLWRMSRPQALWRLLRRESGEGRVDWMGTGAAFKEFLRDAGSSGLRSAVQQRYERLQLRYRSMQPDYPRWVAKYDSPTEADMAMLGARAGAMPDGPLVSILLPVYRPPEKWLRRCLDSVLSQLYPKWELCVADDASGLDYVRKVLDEYAARDERIRVVYRDRNGHIAESSNTALEMARGEFVALLDHDDELPPHALLEVVSAIRENPQWKLVYTDEDKIDEDGQRSDAYFKPDWNYDLLLSQNCVSHLGFFSTDLVRSVGGFRPGYEGSQDHDLALRCVERLRPDGIGHVAKVLYHWRKIAGSTALGVSEKNYAAEAGRRAIADHLRRTGVDGTAEVAVNGYYRVRYALPSPVPKVSLIIPTRDKAELLRTCVGSILEATTYPDFEILVIDNQSVEPATLALFDEFRALPNVRVLRYDDPFNYSAINNHGARHAHGDVLGLVNNDIEVRDGDWLQELVSHACRSGVGAVGCMLYYPDDTIQHAGVITGVHGVAGHVAVGQKRGDTGYFGRGCLVQNLSAVTAACLVVRKRVFDEVGGLDEAIAVAFNDVDFCLRLQQAGYRNVWTPHAWAYHHESASRGLDDAPEKRARFLAEVAFMQRRWGSRLERDPAYNPNLTLTGYPFQLAFPPRLPASWMAEARTIE